jgi:excisionase family DNA binding protein
VEHLSTQEAPPGLSSFWRLPPLTEEDHVPTKIQKKRPADDPLLTDAEVAERLACSPTTAKRLRYNRELSTVHVSARSVRVRASDLDAYLARNTEGAIAEQPRSNGGVGKPPAASAAPPTDSGTVRSTRSAGGVR